MTITDRVKPRYYPQCTKQSKLRFRALLTEDGDERLELLTASRREARRRLLCTSRSGDNGRPNNTEQVRLEADLLFSLLARDYDHVGSRFTKFLPFASAPCWERAFARSRWRWRRSSLAVLLWTIVGSTRGFAQ